MPRPGRHQQIERLHATDHPQRRQWLHWARDAPVISLDQLSSHFLHRYRLERDDGNGGDCDRLAYSGPETSAAVPGLRSGAQYRFRLWAFNEARLRSAHMIHR